jgi:tetratricopeptide (TPR) repeat protein/tRNA A-37 threonylcarbamoyl transferase component Bud32
MMIDSTIAHYRILERLGRGGMGLVYKAEDVNLRRTVALKVLPAELVDDKVARERLLREAWAASRLSHPNIATIYEVAEDDGQLFVAMEFVEGQTLAQLMLDGPVGEPRVLAIGAQAADALEAAHRQGVIHRDVKPSNIMLDVDDQVKVVDFGLALQTHSLASETTNATASTEALRLTRSGSAVGTVSYMSPEQAQGETPDARADLFSLGVVLFEMATGQLPFSGSTPLAMAASIIHDQPTSPRQLRPEMSTGLKEIILSCLAKGPSRRPTSAAHVRDGLRVLRAGESTGTMRKILGSRPIYRHPAVLVFAVMLFVAVAVLVVGTIEWEADPVPPSILNLEARRSYERAGNYEDRGPTLANFRMAEQLYRKAVALEPENPVIVAQLAYFLTRFESAYPVGQIRWDEIKRLTEVAMKASPPPARAWTTKSILLLVDGDPESAVVAARNAIRLDEHDYAGYATLGKARIALGQVDAGLADLRGALQIGEGHLWARTQLADELYNLGRTDEAASEYRKLLEFAPDSPVALNNLGAIYLLRGNYVEAIQQFKRLLDLQPDDYAMSNLGTAYFYLDRLDDAIAAYDKAVQMAPDYPVHQQLLGEAYEQKGDGQEAAAWYARAMRAYNELIPALSGEPRATLLGERAFCEAKLSRFDQARASMEEALAIAPGCVVCLRSAARFSALAGEKARAYDFVRRAVEAGYPREDLRREPTFREYRDDPGFLDLLTN